MSCVSLKAVTCAFGGKPLFEEITLVVDEGERIGLIGPNGSGKSTLLKLIAAEREPDGGEVTWQRGLSTAHVRQSEIFEPHETVLSHLESKIADIDIAEQQRRLSRIIGMTGFPDRDQSVSTLSGGWKKRLGIAAALITEPDLLLLDEPTNHLDLDGILWLESVVEKYRGAIVFVSHDRYFIERVATRVVEINRRYPKGYLSIDGRYSDFLEGQELFIDQLKSQQESLANRVRREVEWLRQGAKARTTKSTARIKQAGELVEALQKFHVDDSRVNAQFSESGRKTKELVKLEEASLQLGDRLLLKDFSFVISPGIRLGIVGSNGSGKTSFLKLLRGELKPSRGRVAIASALRVAFFDQHRAQLNPNDTLHRALAPESNFVIFNGREVHVTGWARRFLLRPEQLSTPVGNLSGGEQARVMVAKMMLQPCDLLILDEPTNDLDIPTLEVLEEALCEFQGGVVVVSHDRFLLDRACTDIVGLRGNGESALFASYMQWELQRDEWIADDQSGSATAQPVRTTSSEQKKFGNKEQRELAGMQDAIMKAEAKVTEIDAQLQTSEVAADPDRLATLCDELAEFQNTVERLYARWEELEELQKQSGHS